MFNHLSTTQKGMALALIGYTAFAFSDANVKHLSEIGYSSFQIIVSLTAIGAGLMLVFSSFLGGVQSLRDVGNFKTHGVRIVFNTAVNVLFVYCIARMPIASLYTVIFTLPFIAAILSMIIYKERVSVQRWISIVAGFSGVVVAFQPWQGGADLFLLALAFVNTVCIASTFLAARNLKGSSLLAIGFYPVLGSCLLLMPLAVMNFTAYEITHVPFFVLAGILMSTGVICVSFAFKIADSAVVTPIVYTEILWAVIFGVLVFGDYPDRWMLVGVGIIILSGVYMLHSENSAKK
ncbi:MAG: DMT family transporter [Alphaproteobacteria bacterium]